MVWKPKLSLLVLLLVGLGPVVSNAQMTVIDEHIATISLEDTPWGQTLTLPQYNASDFQGQMLDEISFVLMGDANSDITINAIENVDVLNGEVGAFISASNSSLGLSLNAIPSGSFAPPTLNLNQATTNVFPTIAGTDSDSVILTGAAMTPYLGSGSYSLNLNATGTNSIQTAGGNYDLFQRTQAEATILVQYKFLATSVPEPSTGVIIGSCFLGFIATRRRRQ